MNPRIKELADQLGPIATIGNWGRVEWADNVYPQLGDKMYAAIDLRKFAELIVAECIEIAKAEMFSKEVIDQEEHIEDREYLRGNNGGIVDVIVAIRNHFRDENEII
jgi:hypothetical protein